MSMLNKKMTATTKYKHTPMRTTTFRSNSAYLAEGYMLRTISKSFRDPTCSPPLKYGTSLNKQLNALANVRIVAPRARRNNPTSEIIRPHTSTNAETLLFITARSIKSRKYKNMASMENTEYGNFLMSLVSLQFSVKRSPSAASS